MQWSHCLKNGSTRKVLTFEAPTPQMVKHTQAIRRQIAVELFERV